MNLKNGLVFLGLSLCLYQKAEAMGEAAVITLDFPVGAENTGMGETGVSVANTIGSIFWNPANVACLYDETYSNFGYTSFHEVLLPALALDLSHDFDAFSMTFDNLFPHVDMGYAWFRNHIDMGENTIFDSLGIELLTVNSSETVTSHSIGVRLFDLFSLGVSFKRYISSLAPGIGGDEYPDDGVAKGHAFDLGMRVSKKFNLNDVVKITPAIGVSALNLGNDRAQYFHARSETISTGVKTRKHEDIWTSYVDVEKPPKDPLPRKGIVGASCAVDVAGLFGYTVVYEIDYNRLAKPDERTKHHGHKLQITPFVSLLFGRMVDTAGERYEKTLGYVLGFNLQRTLATVSSVVKAYDLLCGTNHQARLVDRDNRCTLFGYTFTPNIEVTKSHCAITSTGPNQVRKGQKRDDWTVGVGITAGFSSSCKKRPPPLPVPSLSPDQKRHENGVVVEEENTEYVP